MSGHQKISRAERARRALLGDLRHLIRCRYYGDVLTEDEAGREDLMLLLEIASRDPDEPRLSAELVIKKHAPWMPSDDAENWIDLLSRR